MPQYLTPTATVNPTGMTPAAISAMVADVRSRVVVGLPILASDMSKIQQMYNAFATHTHDVLDYSYVAYAPAPAFPTTTQTDTSASAAKPLLSSTFTPTNDILASEQSAFATALNNIRIHTHSITDHLLP